MLRDAVTTLMQPVVRPQTIRAAGIPRNATIEHLVAALSAKCTDEKDIVQIEGNIVPSCKMADDFNSYPDRGGGGQPILKQTMFIMVV